jgi:hypothetical protein
LPDKEARKGDVFKQQSVCHKGLALTDANAGPEKLSRNGSGSGLAFVVASDFLSRIYVFPMVSDFGQARAGQLPGFDPAADCKPFDQNELRCPDLSATGGPTTLKSENS